LVSAFDPVINKTLKGYGYADDPSARTTAQLYLSEALPKYDAKKGAGIKTFVFNELKRMQRILPRQSQPIPVPEQAALDLRFIDGVERDLKDQLNRDPSVHELSDATGLSSKRITSIRNKYGIPTVTAEALRTSEGAQQVMGVPRDDPNEALWREAVYEGLSPVDQNIMDWAMGLHGQPVRSKTEIARRLKISVPAVTQRAAKIRAKLEEGMGLEIL
jgi:DNA-directed RNA polymerase specialized sigma subunit